MFRSILILVSLVLILASPALAQRSSRYYPSREDKTEFSIQTRYTVAQTFNGEGGSEVKVEDDLGWGFAFGYNMSQHFSLGIGFTWRSLPYTATVVDQDDPDNKRDYGGNLSISTIALQGMWNVFKGKVTPYVTGSLGWTLIDTNIFAGVSSGCWWDPWWGPVCGSFPATYGKSSGTYAVGAGLRAELGETFFLRGGYEYTRDNAESVTGTSMLRLDGGWLF